MLTCLIHGTTQGAWGVFVIKPFVQAASVEVMFARQLANLFIAFKTTQANAALNHGHTLPSTVTASSSYVLRQCLELSYRHPPFSWTFMTFLFAVPTGTWTSTASHNLDHGSKHVLQHSHWENRVYHQHRKHPFWCTWKIWQTHHTGPESDTDYSTTYTHPLVLWSILENVVFQSFIHDIYYIHIERERETVL